MAVEILAGGQDLRKCIGGERLGDRRLGRHDGGVSRFAGQQRGLAESVAGAKRRDFGRGAAADRPPDRHPPRLDQVEPVAGVALTDDFGPHRMRPRFHRTRELGQRIDRNVVKRFATF